MNNKERQWQEQSDKIWALFSENKYSEARDYIFHLLSIDPGSHYLLTRLSNTYYEERQYTEALKWVMEALKIAPKCPLVLWDYAGTLDMLERNEEALHAYKKIIRKGIKKIAYDECGEGIRWAKQLINDCNYRIGLIYIRIGKKHLAEKYFREYIYNRNNRYPSIYNLREVKKRVMKLLNEVN